MLILNGISLHGYCVTDQLYTSHRTLVYRGWRESDRQPVVIKLLRSEYPSFSELAQFRNQYTIMRDIAITNAKHIIQAYSLEPYQNSYALVMEDIGGKSLRQELEQWGNQGMGATPEGLAEFLKIAIQIALALDGLYRHRVIHKDIKPANILINPNTKQVKLIDFSIASLLPRESQALTSPNVLEGTLAYLSPEQTGRMNRGIDYRTDFYSLGITLYELLTGQLPFTSDDPMEIVHCHIAKQPPAIHSFNPTLPPILSDLLGKLMAKNAEDRYRSALGLKHDLEICLQQWQSQGTIERFKLGQRDRSDRFTIPEKLYGRQAEVSQLLAAFERAAAGAASELVLVTGSAGIGKTAMINEVHKPIVRQRGYFIKGKFDQLQRNTPFLAFVQAFRDLIGQLLSESNAQIEQWKRQILSALGENAQVIIEVIPGLEKLIGQQPAVAELSGNAAQNRFNLLFQKFVQVFTTHDHPLVIFLDDLQWADAASLQLMQILMSESDRHYLLLIGAYRDNEVLAAHPLMLTLAEIQTAGASVNAIALDSLQLTDLNDLVADTLNYPLNQALPLTELLYRMTKGNPFFSSQLLKSLHEDGLICFDWDAGQWQVDLAQIQARSLTEDVVEFMATQLQKLPQQTQTVLKFAACIGNRFDLTTLAVVYEKSLTKTADDLWPALQDGLILCSDDYKFVAADDHDRLAADAVNSAVLSQESADLSFAAHPLPAYRFLHDRVQQAAYSLIPDQQKPAAHLKVGQLLLRNTPVADQEENLFSIVNQLNYGRSLIVDPIQRAELAQLNRMAGQKAMAATAYTTAGEYLQKGIDLLWADCWQRQYSLTLALHELAVEAAALCGAFDGMEQLAAAVLQQAQAPLDRVKVYEVKIQAYTSQNRLLPALSTARQALHLLSIDFPAAPDPVDIQQAFEVTAALLAKRTIADLANLPVMKAAEQLAVMQIITSMIPPAYIAAPTLFPLLILSQVNASVQYGNALLSPFFYANYSILLSSILQDIEVATQFGQLALDLAAKSNAKDIKARIYYVLGAFITHGKSHLRETLPLLLNGYHTALESGNLEFVGYCVKDICQHSYFLGQELAAVERDMRAYYHVLKNLQQITTSTYCQIYWQVVLNLLGNADDPSLLCGEAYNEVTMLPLLLKANDISGLHYYYVHKLILCYVFGNHAQAIDHAAAARKYLAAGTGFMTMPIFHFYDSLAVLAMDPKADADAENRLQQVADNQAKLQHWADYAPMNHLHKFYLVEAERYRILGHKADAIDYYDQAIAAAQTHDYLQEKALAYELAGRFYLNWGKEKIAQDYLANAYYCYGRWGALAKVKDLETRYPQLLNPVLGQEKPYLSLSHTASLTSSSLLSNSIGLTNSIGITSGLDLASVVKASQALSGKIQLDKLLSTLMQVMIANAGAEKCALLLLEDGEWIISCQTACETLLLQQQPLEGNCLVPQSVINYVFRTVETLVIDNANAETSFATDPYILKQLPKSVLCTPILSQGKLIGILYLENNLTAGAFTSDRLEVLNLLTTQAAISLQNARLYDTLEQKVQQRTQELNEKNHHLATTLEELQQTQTQLIQTEKMSSLGQMVAGVAHEINNPVNFIYGNLTHASEYTRDLLDLLEVCQQSYPNPLPVVQAKAEEIDLEFVKQDLPKLLTSMKVGAERIRQIVLSLRNFSRLDEADMKPVDIHEGLDSTLLMLQNRLAAKSHFSAIKVIKNYGQLPEVNCFASQLNQVFMNLLSNAIDALTSPPADATRQLEGRWIPCITLHTAMENQFTVVIRIADNGCGITEEVRKKIFDPFFTTKPVGSGTGLGLSISYQIVVKKHQGQLTCHSVLGKGTEFVIKIPTREAG